MVGRFNIEDSRARPPARNAPAWWFSGTPQAPGRARGSPSPPWARKAQSWKCACASMPRKNILIAVAAAVAVIVIIVVVVVVVICKGKISGNLEPAGNDWFLQSSFRLDYGDKSPCLVKQGTTLFDLSGGDDMLVRNDTNFYSDEFECDTVEEYTEKMRKKVGFGGAYEGLGGAVAASSADLLKTRKSIFRQERLQTASSRVVQMNMKKVDLQASRFLEGDARKILLEKEPEEIHEHFGDFYATKLVMGGVYQFTLVAERKDTEKAEEIKGEFEGTYGVPGNNFKGDLGLAMEESTRKHNCRVKARWRVQGGDASKWLGVTEENMDEIKKAWANSFAPDNLQPIEYELHPIWELLEDKDMKKKCPGKAEQLRKFIEGRWREELEKERRRANIDERLRPYYDQGRCFGRFTEPWSSGDRVFLRTEDCRDAVSQEFIYRDGQIVNKGRADQEMCLVGTRAWWNVRKGRTLYLAHCEKEGHMAKWQTSKKERTIRLMSEGSWCLHVRDGGVLEISEDACTKFIWGEELEEKKLDH